MQDTRFDQFTKNLARRHGLRHQSAIVNTAGPTSPSLSTAQASPLDRLKGEQAPGFALPDIKGERVTLGTLLAPARPLMLVFAEPRCGPCFELLPDIGGWQRVYGDRLSIALISSGDVRTNHAMTADYGIQSVLLQQDQEVVSAYGLTQAPAAVLIQPDGRVSAGPRFGARAIRQLVADTLGLILPPAPTHDTRIVGLGEAAPPLRLPDLFGDVVDLSTYRGTPTLLLFWSPGCSHCANVLPEVLAFEGQPNRPKVVVVSRGPIGLNKELGFTSPVVLDEPRAIGQALGVTGTPAAVLIDAMGKVATPVARGTAGVRALMTRSIAQPSASANQGVH